MIVVPAFSSLAELLLLPALTIIIAQTLSMMFGRRLRPRIPRANDNTEGDTPPDQEHERAAQPWMALSRTTEPIVPDEQRQRSPPTDAAQQPEAAETNPQALMGQREQLERIYHIVFLLRQRLVPDVVREIAAISDDLLLVRTAQRKFEPEPCRVPERRSPTEILLTPPIESLARTRQPVVRRVVFEIESHDQGWASNRDGGTWTWFTAVAHRPSDSAREHRTQTTQHGSDAEDGRVNDVQQELDRLDLSAVVRNEVHGDAQVSDEDVVRPPVPLVKGRRHLQQDWTLDEQGRRMLEVVRNPIASHDWIIHRVELTSEDSSWVAELAAGDRIALNACARFAGWTNHVRKATITIYTTAVV